MVFTDRAFLFGFLPIALALIYLGSRLGAKNALILFTSLLFYWYSSGDYVLLLLIAVVLPFAVGRLDSARDRRGGAIVGSAILLLLLGFFKYGGFFAEIAGIEDLPPWFAAAALALPAGISFFTFQAISYMLDVARGTYKPERSMLRFGAYLAFFPQLIAGPIVRYSDVREDLERAMRPNVAQFAEGAVRFAHGLAKKVLIADNAGRIANAAYATGASEVNFATALIGMMAFTVQIYFDFSGYSDMAIGLGRIFGIRFPENFLHPHRSRSITEFWRRWHITLSTWFRDYLYIPLGGNRFGAPRTYLNLALVFVATGLWHGAAWTFVVWGAFHGTFLILERVLLGARARSLVHEGWRYAYALPVVMIGWVLFRADSFDQALQHLRSLVAPLAPSAFALPVELILAATPSATAMTALGFVLILGQRGEPLGPRIVAMLDSKRLSWLPAGYALLGLFAAGVAAFAGGYSPFLYFRF